MKKRKAGKEKSEKQSETATSPNQEYLILNQLKELGFDDGILENISSGKCKGLISNLVSVEQHHRGPLPALADLMAYAQVIPEGANRIMEMAEKQQRHRMELENLAIEGQLKQSIRGQIFAFVIAFGIVAAGTICVLNGYAISGTILSGLGLTGIVSAFIKGKRDQEKELRDRRWN